MPQRLAERAGWSGAHREFKPLAERYPELRELTQPTYGRAIPIPPKLSVALAVRIGRALTPAECEVLDRPANRWFPNLYWQHDLAKHVDVLIDETRRRLAELADELGGKRVLCRKCLKDALIIDRRIGFFDDE